MPPKQGFLINLGCILGLQGLCELPEFEGKPYIYAFFFWGGEVWPIAFIQHMVMNPLSHCPLLPKPNQIKNYVSKLQAIFPPQPSGVCLAPINNQIELCQQLAYSLMDWSCPQISLVFVAACLFLAGHKCMPWRSKICGCGLPSFSSDNWFVPILSTGLGETLLWF